MSATDATGQAASASDPPKPGEVRLEVVTVPVSDVDRAKAFYESLGWKLDIDIEPGEGVRIVQFTPPGSGCSISFGKGITPAEPGSFQGSELAVYDIDAAREDLIGRGIEVSELYHLDGGPVPGPDPERQSYRTFASFKDPDGNTWQLQEIKERLPGR
jgi:catechol 2,3-dioxygenase-like lactoylglutathione lyase family enzyme